MEAIGDQAWSDLVAWLEERCASVSPATTARREHGFAPRIRIGVHATRVRQSAGDYGGRGGHEASRIASLAGPDEIVASQATVPSGLTASEPRQVSVKRIAKPIDVVSLDWALRVTAR